MSHYDNEREQHDLWRDAPEGAEYVVEGRGQFQYYKYNENADLMVYAGAHWIKSQYNSVSHVDNLGFRVQPRPQPTTKQLKKAQEASTANDPVNHIGFGDDGLDNVLKPTYKRDIIGLDGVKTTVDIYRVLDAFKTDSPALDHAAKKILCPGTRHQKGREQDLREAIKSIEAELLLMSQR